jgi:hypothetical protein
MQDSNERVATATATVEFWQAQMMAALLRRFQGDGVSYTTKRHWLLFLRFRITGPRYAVDYLAELVEGNHHLWGEWRTPQGGYELLRELQQRRERAASTDEAVIGQVAPAQRAG